MTEKIKNQVQKKPTNNNNDDNTTTLEKKKPKKQMLEPLIPRVDPLATLSSSMQHTKSSFVVYLALAEDLDSSWTAGLTKCSIKSEHQIQASCFQRDGTRHVTLWQGLMTWNEASTLQFSSEFATKHTAPFSVDIVGLTNWKGGVYLQLSESCTSTLLHGVLDQLQGLPKGGRKCDHLSLYRKRNASNALAYPTFARIRKAVTDHNWGSVAGVSIRIKQVGTEYDECRVLWSSSSTTF